MFCRHRADDHRRTRLADLRVVDKLFLASEMLKRQRLPGEEGEPFWMKHLRAYFLSGRHAQPEGFHVGTPIGTMQERLRALADDWRARGCPIDY